MPASFWRITLAVYYTIIRPDNEKADTEWRRGLDRDRIRSDYAAVLYGSGRDDEAFRVVSESGPITRIARCYLLAQLGNDRVRSEYDKLVQDYQSSYVRSCALPVLLLLGNREQAELDANELLSQESQLGDMEELTRYVAGVDSKDKLLESSRSSRKKLSIAHLSSGHGIPGPP